MENEDRCVIWDVYVSSRDFFNQNPEFKPIREELEKKATRIGGSDEEKCCSCDRYGTFTKNRNKAECSEYYLSRKMLREQLKEVTMREE